MSIIPGEQFIRTLTHYLDSNQGRLLSSSSSPTSSFYGEDGMKGIMSGIMNSSNNLLRRTSMPAQKQGALGGLVPYMSLLSAATTASASTGWAATTSYMPKRPCLTLDIHHLYFLLVQFEHSGLDIGDPALLGPLPDGGTVETETSATMGEAPSIMSVNSIASTLSTLSLSTHWNFWRQQPQQDKPIHMDIEHIYNYFANITALRLHMSVVVDPHTGMTRSGQRTIAGYETPLPQDGSVVLSLLPFKRLTSLELANVHPRMISDWTDLSKSLVRLVVKGANVEDCTSVLGLEDTWDRLRYLSLQDNNITTLDTHAMSQIRPVSHLNLSNNLLIDVPTALSTLFNLQSLQLAHNMISSVTGINTILGNILELDLSGNRIVQLAGLDRLWALERLDLRDNQIEDCAEVGRLTGLPNIADIWISGNPFTLLQPDHRVQIFKAFADVQLDIRLDGSTPSFLERRRINPDKADTAAPPAAVIAGQSNSTDTATWPAAHAGEDEKPEGTAPDGPIAMVKPKNKKNKRLIRLGQSDDHTNDSTNRPDQRMSRIAELEQTVQNETLARRSSRRPRSSMRRSRSPGQQSTKSSKSSKQNRSLSPFTDRTDDVFRRKIEAIRQEAERQSLYIYIYTYIHNLFKMSKASYDIALWLFNLMIDIFFREVRPRGSHKIPQQGPVIFVVAPHANQFVDPIILMRECKRRVSFLIAEKSMHQKGVGTFARMVNAIPVIRPQDSAIPGKGVIHLDREYSLLINGTDTEFLSQLKPRDSIVLPGGAGVAEVARIVSDTQLELCKEFKALKAIDLLTNSANGTKYKCMPHIEQGSVYEQVYEQLYRNECITVFPEGGSHDRAEILPLKAGVTLMALGAMAKYPGLDVKIVPCGLNYFHAHRFRSRAVIEFGTPLTISTEMVDMYKCGGNDKRDACGKLLDTIYGALKSVTVNAGSYETLMLIQAGRRLYKPAHRKLRISQVVDLNRRFLIGYNLFKDDPKVIDLQQKVLAYNQLLKYHGIKDHQVSKTSVRGRRRTAGLILKRICIITLLALWAFPGGLLNLPVAILAKVISQRKAADALKGSTVKIAGRDVLATWKLLVGLVVLPTLYAFYSFIMLVVVLQTNLDPVWKWLLPIATWILLPFVSYASLRFGEIGHDMVKSLKPSIMALLDSDAAKTLCINRETLSRDITDLINEYGPRVFPDFDADYIRRISQPAPSPSMSRSSSSVGLPWTNTQSKLPKIASGFLQQAARMDWLDDKNIFNWGRTEESDADDFYFLDLGEASSDQMASSSKQGSRNRSRASSFVNGLLSMEGFKIESMTSLPPLTKSAHHPIFRIDDIEENTSELIASLDVAKNQTDKEKSI
ncbi:hypothetical protein J3Q64DRAFT_1658671, partial [Phycomyces blakesleeanus]